jgi:Lysine methyltransferase
VHNGPVVRFLSLMHNSIGCYNHCQHLDRPLLDIMCRNVKLNNLESSVTVSELNWSASCFGKIRKALFMSLISRGSPLTTDIPRPNLILAADCVYFEPAFALLVQTLSDLVDTTTEVLFCYKKRRKVLLDMILHVYLFTLFLLG